MPRQARIDAPGALHHVIVRGIARRRVFADHADRDFFIEWLGLVLSETKTQCLAWAIILRLFGGKRSIARRRYREFVQKGIAAGRRRDLTGGGLIRSVGGWSAAKALRMAGTLQKGDERILGDGEFVEQVLAQAKETFERKYRLKRRGVRVERIAERVAEILDIDVAQLWAGGKQPQVVRARRLFCYWATNELGVSQVWLSRKLGLSQPAISLSVARGRQIVSQRNYEIGNL